MPNWVSVVLSVEGNVKEVNKFVKEVQRTKDEATDEFDDNPLCFQKIIPRPANKSDDWYNWNIANWGTKWGACRTEFDIKEQGKEALATYNFDTAWSFPEPIINKLITKYKKLTFQFTGDEESNSFWVTGEGANGEASIEYGEFETCEDFQAFGKTHHYCPECNDWTDECNNSNIQEWLCDECKTKIEATDTELWEGELND